MTPPQPRRRTSNQSLSLVRGIRSTSSESVQGRRSSPRRIHLTLSSFVDIGCGTGRALDLGIAAPARYAAVDQSQAMLNTLIRKHPQVAKIYPSPIERLLDVGEFTPNQFDLVVLDRAVELTPIQLGEVERIAQRALVVDSKVLAR